MKKLLHSWRAVSCALALCVAGAAAFAQAGGLIDPARGPTPINGTTHPPRLGNAVNDDQPRARNYDLQPPVIPHRTDGYQIDKNFNKCLDCHAREKTAFSLAVPVSATHYIDRSGKTLDRVSTRRYFCMQCHVSQEGAAPFVGNSFRPAAAGPGMAAGASAPAAASNRTRQ